MVCEEKWWSNRCDSKDDIRYDPDISADIVSLDPLHSKFQGFWIGEVTNRDADFNTRQPSPFISGVNMTSTNPYPANKIIGLWNITLSSTRWLQHDIYIRRPNDDPIFCSIPLNPPATNVADDGFCGLNGYAYRGDSFKASTFEKTKVLNTVGGTGFYFSGPNFKAETTVVGKYTAIEWLTLDYMPFQAIYTFTFDETYNNIVSELTFYDLSNGVKVSNRNIANMTRVDDATSWMKYFEDYTANYNVTEATKNTVQLPVNGQCLVNDSNCPTTTTWCAAGDAHPDCGPSPYNEDTTVSAGVVAGLVVAFAFASIVIIVGSLQRINKNRMEEQKRRLRNQFARRIAASVVIANAEEALSMDALMKEFRRIDTDGSGEISREKLHHFIMDKKVGSISEADFNPLFIALDVNDNGTVEFIEFCAFLGGCVDELNAAATLSKQQKMERVSKAIIRKSRLG